MFITAYCYKSEEREIEWNIVMWQDYNAIFWVKCFSRDKDIDT